MISDPAKGCSLMTLLCIILCVSSPKVYMVILRFMGSVYFIP